MWCGRVFRVTFSKVFWYVDNNGTSVDARRRSLLTPSVDELSHLLSVLRLTVVTDDTQTADTHVRRSACFQLVFDADVRQYDAVVEVLSTAVRRRIDALGWYDENQVNVSVAVAFNEEYIVPSEYVRGYTSLVCNQAN